MLVAPGLLMSSGRPSADAAPPTKTYPEFLAHIATLPILANKNWGLSAYGLSGPVGTVANYTTTANTSGRGIMAGTSWFDGSVVGAFDDTNTNVAPSIIHGLPSSAEASNQENNGYQIYVTVEIIAATTRTGLARNSFTSTAALGTANRKITKIIYWTGTEAMQVNPSVGSAPSPYPF